MKIENIDQNFKVETIDGFDDIIFMDIRCEPFSVYGLYCYKTEPFFCRMPNTIAKTVNEGVLALSTNTAGGRIRFATDSSVIAIRCKMPSISRMPHMPLCGSSGFDLYEHIDGVDIYLQTFVPPYDMCNGYQALRQVSNDGKLHKYTIHFPLYNDVTFVEIGIKANARLERGAAYRDIKPIVYYGSSITQGGCASRPGNAYQNIISAKRNIDHINLGFSGSARGEAVMAEYIASLDMSLFVCDYDHNAPTSEHLSETHEALYRTVRSVHPTLPILFLTRPKAQYNADEEKRLDIVYRTYQKAHNDAPELAHFIDGRTLFGPTYADACTVDGCHPNDAGFVCMADAIGNEIDKILK